MYVGPVLDERPGGGALVVGHGEMQRGPPFLVHHISLTDCAEIFDGFHVTIPGGIQDRVDLWRGSLLCGCCGSRIGGRRPIAELFPDFRQEGLRNERVAQVRASVLACWRTQPCSMG